jgi:Ca2+-binding EF-hand superfamily protein
MASLNAKGITMVTLQGSGLSSGRQPSSPGTAYGSVSKGDLEVVASGFGASTQQADQDTALMDTDGNGRISNAELLDAMSQTSNGDGPLAQSLRQMMDTNHDGSVSGSEFVNLETAMVSAEK